MNFKQWLAEWEGFTFPGDDSQYYNSPAFPRSKYKGPGDPKQQPEDSTSKVDVMYGFKDTPHSVKKKKKKRHKKSKYHI